MKKLLILTGPVKSGKSTRLISFVKNRKDISGILSPLIDGKKYLCDISTKEKRLLEADSSVGEIDIVSVGKYKFRKKVFDWGKDILLKAYLKNPAYLIIDEVGTLEFNGEGLSPAVFEIIKNYWDFNYKIIVVCREKLLGQFFEHFELNSAEVEFISFD